MGSHDRAAQRSVESRPEAPVARCWLKVGECGRNVGGSGLAIGVLGRG